MEHFVLPLHFYAVITVWGLVTRAGEDDMTLPIPLVYALLANKAEK